MGLNYKNGIFLCDFFFFFCDTKFCVILVRDMV